MGFAVCLTLAGILTAAAASAPSVSTYTIPGSSVFPEGVAHRAGSSSFFVGSFQHGTIFRGTLGQAAMQVFLPGGADGRTEAAGLKVDGQGRLYVAGGESHTVWVYDTASGVLIRKFTSASAQFLNDLTIAPNGDVYVTDSFHPVLWRIPAGAVHASSSPGALHAWLGLNGTPIAYQSGVNLNGIVSSANGKYLVVAQPNVNRLFRIEIATKQVTQIALTDGGVSSDGLLLTGRILYAVDRPNIDKVSLAVGLASGTVVSRTTDPSFAYPTTAAFAGQRLLVVYSQFDKRNGGTPQLPFTVSSAPIP